MLCMIIFATHAAAKVVSEHAAPGIAAAEAFLADLLPPSGTYGPGVENLEHNKYCKALLKHVSKRLCRLLMVLIMNLTRHDKGFRICKVLGVICARG